MIFCSLQVNGRNWRTSSYMKLSRFKKTKVECFLSYVEDRPNAKNTSIIIYTCKYIQNMFTKVELLEETNRGGKEGKKDSE
jgi:hypothetical protein